MPEFLHPHVSSKIIDNSTVFLTSQGVTELFAAFTSDIGPDNVITEVTSLSEFTFLYGEPNFSKHGQTAYNIMNWLQSQGGVSALRVTPEDAKYAHAIVNIQTKVSDQQVENNDGDLTTIPLVDIKPTVTYSKANYDLEGLKSDLEREGKPETIDGYENNWLFAVYPKGRGEANNNLGFRISLTDSYDGTYDFRLYNFEVIRTRESGAEETLEGPFLVSLSPDAVGTNQESMFIEFVLDKYSDYFGAIFNEDGYDALGEIVNEYVNPNRIDFLLGESKEDDTFTHPELNKSVDTHIHIGTVVPYSDVQRSITNIDNTVRNEYYTDMRDRRQTMIEVLSAEQDDSLSTLVANIASFDMGSLDGGDLFMAYDNLDSANSVFTTDKGNFESESDDASTYLNNINTFYDAIDEYTPVAFEANSIIEAIAPSANSTEADVQLTVAKNSLKIIDVVKLERSEKTLKTMNLKADNENAMTNSEKIEVASDTLVYAEDVLNYVNAKDVTDLDYIDDTAFESLVTSLETALDTATNEYTSTQDDIDALKDEVTAVLDGVDTVMLDTLLEVATDKVEDAYAACLLAEDAIEADYDGIETSADEDTITANIESISNTINQLLDDTYTNNATSFLRSVSFGNGDDGSIAIGEDDRDATIESLLVKAYSGSIDTNLTNKKLYPIDMVLDANYSDNVKNAIVSLCSEIRKDFIGIVDTGMQSSAGEAKLWRENSLPVSSYFISIFAQDFIVYDEYSGKDIKVTTPYFLASKIPTNDAENGIHINFAGPRRGTISGFKHLSWNPNEAEKENLYKRQINYVEKDPRRTKIGTQLTSQTNRSALSNINNVRTLLKIKRDIEILAEDYQFEYNDATTQNAFQRALDGLLNQWVTNRACKSISGSVYASDYDLQQGILRVKVEIVFSDIIERIVIDLIVNR